MRSSGPIIIRNIFGGSEIYQRYAERNQRPFSRHITGKCGASTPSSQYSSQQFPSHLTIKCGSQTNHRRRITNMSHSPCRTTASVNCVLSDRSTVTDGIVHSNWWNCPQQQTGHSNAWHNHQRRTLTSCSCCQQSQPSLNHHRQAPAVHSRAYKNMATANSMYNTASNIPNKLRGSFKLLNLVHGINK